MEKEMVSIKIDTENAGKITKFLIEPFDKSPVEKSLDILMGFTGALHVIAAQIKEETETDDEDAIEKQILKWLSIYEKIGDMHFSKYINIYDKVHHAVLFTTEDGLRFVVPCKKDQIDDVIKAHDFPHIVEHEVITWDDSFVKRINP